MPIAILKFKLPDEQSEHRDAVQGGAAKSVLWEMDQTMRAWLKHGFPDRAMVAGEADKPDADKSVQYLRDNLRDLCYAAGINLDE
jgi:hypothetical protein